MIMEVSISIKDLDEVKEIIASLEECVNTLSRIAAWDELSLKYRVDHGFNGQRDYYRQLAIDTLNRIKEKHNIQ